MTAFEQYAPWYDLLYQDKDYVSETSFVDEQLRRHGAGTGTLLDLGCGTGVHAVEFARKGWTVTGIDLSPDMIRRADARRSGAAGRLRFRQGDVSEIGPERDFDAVVSLFHVASYQTSPAKLKGMLANANAALKPGGILLFDYWYGGAVLAQGVETRVKVVEQPAASGHADRAVRSQRVRRERPGQLHDVLRRHRTIVDTPDRRNPSPPLLVSVRDRSTARCDRFRTDRPLCLAVGRSSELAELGGLFGRQKEQSFVKRYRIGVVLELPLEVGGGFQQSLNDIMWLREWAGSADIDVVVFTTLPRNIPILADLGIQAELLRIGLFDRLFLFLKYSGVFDLLQYALRTSPPFEKRLIRNDIDIVYFTTTSNWHLVLYKLPFIITIFDGCHRDTPEFDEVREFAEFERREVVFRSASTKAALVIANAPEIIDTLCRRYAMERDRAVCIPFSPSPYVSRSTANDDQDAAILQKYGLEPNYLFYPAQFWSHKKSCDGVGGAGDVARAGIEVDTGAVRIGPRRASRRRAETKYG